MCNSKGTATLGGDLSYFNTFIIFYSDCDDGGKPSSGPVYDQGARTACDGTLQDN